MGISREEFVERLIRGSPGHRMVLEESMVVPVAMDGLTTPIQILKFCSREGRSTVGIKR